MIRAENPGVPKVLSLQSHNPLEFITLFQVLPIAIVCHQRLLLHKISSRCGCLLRTFSRVIWICISWTFRHSEIFQKATQIAIKHSTGPVQTMSLPILERIIRESIDRPVDKR